MNILLDTRTCQQHTVFLYDNMYESSERARCVAS